jgi:hypothetical protein
MLQSEIRHNLLRNGFVPTPVNGKRPLLNDWPRIKVNKEVVDTWGEVGNGTGAVCGTTAAIDLDILDADAVRICLAIVREMLPGVILERTGLAPKVLVPIHTPEPFRKILKKLTAPDGKVHKIELLCDGQQFVVEGIHPDTKQPYVWKNLRLHEVSLMHLPIVSERRAHEFLDRCAAELKSKLGWLVVSGLAPASDNNVLQFAPDVDQRLADMTPGVDVNDALFRAVGSRLWSGVPMQDIVAELTDVAMAKAPGADWSPESQRNEIEHMCLRTILKDVKLYPLLTDRYREQLERLQADGYRAFKASRNRYGPYILPDGAAESAGGNNVIDGSVIEQIPLSIADWKARSDIKPMDPLLGELLHTTGRAIFQAPTGLGKTNFLMGAALHISSGIDFLHWRVPEARSVLYVDGEMSRRLLQERILDGVRRLGEIGMPPKLFVFSTEDVEDFPMLTDPRAQQIIWDLVARIEKLTGERLGLIAFDNVMSLVGGDMREQDPWRATLPFAKAITRREIGQIWAHHTGHDTGRGYGDKTREWQMDVVMMGVSTGNESSAAGLEFKLTFSKHRERQSRNWQDFTPCMIRLTGDVWTCQENIPLQKRIAPKVTRFLGVLQDVIRTGPTFTYQRHQAVYFDAWRAECERQGLLRSSSAELFTARKTLGEAGYIAYTSDVVWLV